MWRVAVFAAGLTMNLAGSPQDTLEFEGVHRQVIARPGEPVPFEKLPSSIRDVLRNPERTMAALLESHPAYHPAGVVDSTDVQKFFGYRARSQSLVVPTELAREIGRGILADQCYNPGLKPCIFQPNILYTFYGPDEAAVNALVCHGCSEVVLYADSTRHFRHIDNVNSTLVDFGLEIFPEDSVLVHRRAKEAAHR